LGLGKLLGQGRLRPGRPAKTQHKKAETETNKKTTPHCPFPQKNFPPPGIEISIPSLKSYIKIPFFTNKNLTFSMFFLSISAGLRVPEKERMALIHPRNKEREAGAGPSAGGEKVFSF
jgi:hypothetical protein